MIRSIAKIKNLSILKVTEEIDFKSINSIDFDDIEIGAGGFGKIYRVLSINGNQSNRYVIKIFTDKNNADHGYDTIEKLHLKLKQRELKSLIPAYIEHPEILGVPFVALKGYDEIEEIAVTAFIMLNLNELGFEDYGSESSDNRSYRGIQLQDKIHIAHQLAIAIDFLHSVKFIHSDIKEAAIWYHPEKKQLALIDFDSGYHFDTQEKPSTLGAIGHWISGGLRNIIGANDGGNDRTVKERLSEEHWILSNALFELMFDVMPYFFLKDSDDITKKRYLKKNKWPEIDQDSAEFLIENKPQYELLIQTLAALKNAGLGDLLENFSNIFNKGYSNKSKRITPSEWSVFLKGLNESLSNVPEIEYFDSEKKEILEKNEEVIVLFKTSKARYVKIDSTYISPILENSSIVICENKENNIVITAFNEIDNIKQNLYINARPRFPQILEFDVDKNIRDTLKPLVLSWKTNDIKLVKITNITGDFEANGTLSIEPRGKTIYNLSAYGFFDEILDQEITVDVIRPRIMRFDWEINLNEGIKNIDLFWETENSSEVEIIPKVGIKESKGLTHIAIEGETLFTIKARGLFTTAEEEVKAYPFPAPVIKQLFVETPKMQINTKIESVDLKSFKKLNVNLNSINAGIPSIQMLELPKFETENSLIKTFDDPDNSTKDFAIHTIFKRIKNVIQQS